MSDWRRPGTTSRRQAWLFFIFSGLLLGMALSLLGFARPVDALKTTVWWLTLGSALVAVAHWRSPRLAGAVALAVYLIFGLDGAVQGLLRGFFGVNPQPSLIAEALANTNTSEASGFVLEQRWPIIKGLLFWLALGGMGLYARHLWRASPHRASSRTAWGATAALLLVSALLHFNPTMLRQQPLLRWAVVYHRHSESQQEILGFEAQRAALWAQHADWQVRLLKPAPRTVVVFVGESGNRMNWSWTGYPRSTLRPLDEALAQLPGQLTVFTQARSAEAFTLPSLKLAFTPATRETPDIWKSTPDFTLLAKAAGFHVTWLSNQPGHEGWFAAIARNADAQQFINNGNWRDSSAVDNDLTGPLQRLLAQPAHPLELVVVHLMGQHFHYDQRCPAHMHPFRDVHDDEVMRTMQAAGRSQRVQASRNDYDDAIYCGAQALGEMLKTVQAARADRLVSAIYFSDHGQEVGHHRDFSGHSEQDDSGYTIPMWVWHNRAASGGKARILNDRPFTLDHLDQALHTLLNINSRWYDPSQDPLQAQPAH